MKRSALRRLRLPVMFVLLIALSSAVGSSGCVRVVSASRLRALESRPSAADWDAAEADRAVCDAELRACQALGRRLIPHVQ